MLPPSGGSLEVHAFYSQSWGEELYLKEPPPGSLSLFFWFPQIWAGRPMGLLPVWMMAPFPIAPVEEKAYKIRGKRSRIKERSNAIIETSPPICIKGLTTTFSCLYYPRGDGWAWGGAVSLSPGWLQSVALSISLRFTGSPYTPKTASRSETRFPERHKDCQSEFKLDFNRHVPRQEAQKSIFRTIPAFQFMGIKQPTDLLPQAIFGKGADQICMHLRSHTHSTGENTALWGERSTRLVLGRCLWASVGSVVVNQCE